MSYEHFIAALHYSFSAVSWILMVALAIYLISLIGRKP